MNKIFIKDLKENDTFESTFLVKDKKLGVGKNGKSYLVLIIGDNSGEVDARLWDQADQASKECDIGDVVKLKGQVQLFQNRKQIIIHKFEKIIVEDLKDYIPQSKVDPNDLYVQVLQIVRTIKNQHLLQLALNILEDEEIKTLLLKAPAARSIHHAWAGGLLEHVLSMLKILDFMATHYSFLSRDLIIFGGVFHDLGKVWELSIEQGIQYTDRGRLLGHIYMMCELIDKKSSKILGFPEDLKDYTKHIILSHHGKVEYGSPKRPKFLEALIVAMVDDLDSKMSTVEKFIENERDSGQNWSRYNENFERYFLLENLKRKVDEQ